MKQLVQEFSGQLEAALGIGKAYRFRTEKREFSSVVLTGLGGSGIGGSIVQNYAAPKLKIPFVVNKNYDLPAFCGKDTLVIVSSYSGNTEETVDAMKQALKAGCTVVCVTSGGIIAGMAEKRDLDCILLPSGMPPRACLGYSLVQVLYVLAHFGLISKSFEKEIRGAIALITDKQQAIRKQATALAKKLLGKVPVIYASDAYEGVAVRFRQQINENSKMLCWHHVIPEMNHNELVGWRNPEEDKAVVILRSETDHKRIQLRMEINKKVIRKYTKNITEIWSDGSSYFERAFYLVHLTDWVSVLLAELQDRDPVEVKVIDFLKAELAAH